MIQSKLHLAKKTSSMKQAIFIFTLLLFLASTVARSEDKTSSLSEKQKVDIKTKADTLRATYLKLHRQGNTTEAVKIAKEELQLREKLFAGQNHSDLAKSLGNFAALLHMSGQSQQAIPYLEQSLKMQQRLHKDRDHFDLVSALEMMGILHKAMGQLEKALPYFEQAMPMWKRLYKNQDNPNLASKLDNLGSILKTLQQYKKALSYYEQALQMRQRLYKNQDHQELAQSLRKMGALLKTMGQLKRAQLYHEQTLGMWKRLHNNKDHLDIAQSLNRLGLLLKSMGESEKSLPYFEQALAMWRRMHKNQDHLDIAVCLNNMATLLQETGKLEDAMSHFSQALEMQKRLLQGNDHANLAFSLNNLGALLQAMGQHEESLAHYEQALAMWKRLHKNQDHFNIAICLNNIGTLLEKMGKFENALTHLEQALRMKKRLYHSHNNSDIAISLNNLGSLLQAMGRWEKALPYYEQSLSAWRRIHQGKDHPNVATSLNNLGTLLREMGQFERAMSCSDLALKMRKRIHGKQDHPSVAQSLSNVGFLLFTMGQYQNVLPYYEQALAMRKRIYKNQDHPELAESLNNMGLLFEELGQLENALLYYQQTLEMQKRFYKKQDHPNLAGSLNNTGFLLHVDGQLEKALQHYEHSLEMLKRLHGSHDHPTLAILLNNAGTLARDLGQHEKALRYYKNALAIRNRLYDDQDHPDLASSFSNMGFLYLAMRQEEKGLKQMELALAMRRRLYKGQTHPNVALSLNNLGSRFQSMGQPEKALQSYEEALAIYQEVNSSLAYTSGLADAVSQLKSFPPVRSGLLSALRVLNNRNGQSYQSIWTSKAALAQLFRTRRAIEDRQTSEKLKTLLGNYRMVQRKLTGLLAHPVPVKGDSKRDEMLAQLTEEQQRLEQEISQQLPEQTNLAKLEFAQLKKALTPQDVFLDFYRYEDFSSTPENNTFRYVVFVVTPNDDPIWVDISGTADELELAITRWREALFDWKPEPPSIRRDLERTANRYALKVRELLWEPLEPHLPKKCKRIYISPDGNLARVPFAAIPGMRDENILLDDYALATVESGPFLWEHLTRQRASKNSAETLLITGGVKYSPEASTVKEKWGYLKGSEQEAHQVGQLWGQRGEVMVRTGHTATTDWLLESLPTATYAHLATHGEFQADEYARERQRLDKRIEHQIAMLGSETSGSGFNRGVGVRNPLGYVGIVMAHANDPAPDSPDLGIVSGTSLWPLDLSGMKLCVLSACDTGLGQHTSGAGVQNLQLALHVAGCENVIASLWEVDDIATSALMSKFYFELWERDQPPIEALRQAQLLIRNSPSPELIEKLAGKRGAIDFTKTVKKQPSQQPPKEPIKSTDQPKHMPAKYWAAFTLSGVGK